MANYQFKCIKKYSEFKINPELKSILENRLEKKFNNYMER